MLYSPDLLHHLPSDVAAAVLFGSRSRGDADADSDTDIAVFGYPSTPEDLIELKAACCACPSIADASLSVYSTATAERMAENGSLFLWHLCLEGIVILARDGWIDSLLSGLRPYDRFLAQRDLATFDLATADVCAALDGGNETLAFEAASLCATLRGVGMIVAMLQGRPTFGRTEPMERLREALGDRYGLQERDVRRLAASRLAFARGRPSDEAPFRHSEILPIAHRTKEIVEAASELID